MAARAAGLRAAVLRVLFLGVLAVGVISMHTIGHAGAHDGWGTLSAAGSRTDHMALAGYAPRVAAAADLPDPCDQHRCLAGMQVPMSDDPAPGRSPGDTGVVVMCLAVFLGIGLLALLAAALSRRRQPVALQRGWRLPGARRPAGTGGNPVLTLRLVEVAVLRM